MIALRKIEPGDALPAGFERLAEKARAEGHRMLDRLASAWRSGEARFDRPGERLMAAWADGVLAGVGGLTLDPAVPGALRMRRFYVSPAFRRQGVGASLARDLLASAQSHPGAITVNAQPASFAFWEALGFSVTAGEGITHRLALAEAAAR